MSLTRQIIARLGLTTLVERRKREDLKKQLKISRLLKEVIFLNRQEPAPSLTTHNLRGHIYQL